MKPSPLGRTCPELVSGLGEAFLLIKIVERVIFETTQLLEEKIKNECFLVSIGRALSTKNLFQIHNKYRKIMLDSVPKQIKIYIKITMNQVVAHSNNIIPGNL